MSRRRSKVDKPLLTIALLLIIAGVFIYLSAVLALLARDTIRISSVLTNHVLLGLGLGSMAMYFFSVIHYRTWRKYALAVFLISLGASLLVFIPGLGISHGGARRWVALGPVTFQPSEFLKLGYIIYLAAWLSGVRDRVKTLTYGVFPFLILTAVTGLALLLEPDTDTFVILAMTGVAMLIASGAKWSHISFLGLLGLGLVAVIALMRPYVFERFKTFLDPAADPLGAGYQIQQSLIAIGSGGFTGRGFGQSIQKFHFLPEAIGDSIFAVAAEEFGFIGAVILIGLFVAFAVRGLTVASRSSDSFGGLLGTGIVILIVIQSFVNMSAMLGLLPLSGIPLLFVSHGGSALLFTLISVGILLSISRYSNVRR